MHSERPNEIRASHLARKAIVYVRQSTDDQVKTNTGSTDYQRGQANHARLWGWPEDLIEINCDDLGLSGVAADHRPGYKYMLEEIVRGLVGIILLADMMRGGRDAAEWLRLIALCRIHDVLIVVDGKVHDLSDHGDRLMAQLRATLTEYDNVIRRETLMHGRITKAQQGHAVSAPPCGYVRMPDGSWEKDPDPTVQSAIAAVFRAFHAERSCKRTVKALKTAGVCLPRRMGALLRWAPPQIQTVYQILIHPAYKGEYPFRRRTGDPRAGRDRRGHLKLRKAPADKVIRTELHHEPYVTSDEWHQIQTTLKLNGRAGKRSNLGPGCALCQGLIACGLHNGWTMVSTYKALRDDGTRSYNYYCQGDDRHGSEQCGRLNGRAVDDAVAAATLARLDPPRIELLREAVQRFNCDERSELQRRKIELNRLRQQEALLEDRFVSLDASSTQTAKDLEKRLESVKRDVLRLERALDDGCGSPAIHFDENNFQELVELCTVLPDLWSAPSTTVQDRKQLLRLMIDEIVLEWRDRAHARLRITWKDGESQTIEIDTTLREHMKRLMVEMNASGMSYDEIAAAMNKLDFRTHRHNRWNPIFIAQKLRRILKS